MMCMGDCVRKPPIYNKIMKKKCTHNNGMLENRLMYLNQFFLLVVINALVHIQNEKS